MHRKLLVSSPDSFNVVTIRLNTAYRDMIGEIITCLPKVRIKDNISIGQQLLSFETSRCLESIRSPLQGSIVDIANETMVLTPGDITSDTVLFQVRVQANEVI